MPKPRKTIPKVGKKPVRKRLPIRFLDLGSGAVAEHGWRLAAHRKDRLVQNRGKFVSVDLEKAVLTDKKGRVLGQPHHQFVHGDVFAHLDKLKPNSVRVVNDNMFIDELLAKNALKMLANNDPFNVEEIKPITRNFATKVFRVLVPNGRFFITVPFHRQPLVTAELQRAGFIIQGHQKLTESEARKGPSNTARIFVDAEHYGKKFGLTISKSTVQDNWPTRISARKPREATK